MCWESKKYKEIKTAEEDIKVFKIVDGKLDQIGEKNPKFLSCYQCFTYELDKAYSVKPLEIYFTEEGTATIYEGLHSYDLEQVEYNNAIQIDMGYLRVYNKITNAQCALISPRHGYVFVKLNCIIPKGSQYIINESGEVVSNKLKTISYEVIQDVATMK